MRTKIRVLAIIYFFFVSTGVYGQYAHSTYVQGGFCSAQNGEPVPGLMVSLVHPQLGRSQPSFTNQYGNFQMFNIPIHQVPYYLEVYWGQRLIFRSQILVQGPVSLPMRCI